MLIFEELSSNIQELASNLKMKWLKIYQSVFERLVSPIVSKNPIVPKLSSCKIFPASRFLIPKYLLEMSCNFCVSWISMKASFLLHFKVQYFSMLNGFVQKIRETHFKSSKIPQARGLLYLVTPLPNSYRGKKIVAYLFEIPIRFSGKNPYLMKAAAALPHKAMCVVAVGETQFQAERWGTLEMRELFLTVEAAAFHAAAAWMTSPPPVLPSEENWILTRRRDQAQPAARHNFFFEAAATAAPLFSL